MSVERASRPAQQPSHESLTRGGLQRRRGCIQPSEVEHFPPTRPNRCSPADLEIYQRLISDRGFFLKSTLHNASSYPDRPSPVWTLSACKLNQLHLALALNLYSLPFSSSLSGAHWSISHHALGWRQRYAFDRLPVCQFSMHFELREENFHEEVREDSNGERRFVFSSTAAAGWQLRIGN